MKHIIVIFFLLLSAHSQATGPSWIQVDIYPISVNSKGDILCRTRFEENPMGAHHFMPVEYGLCIITNNALLEFPTHKLSYPTDDDYDRYQRLRESYDQQVQQCNNKKISSQERQLRKKYGFYTCNIKKYQRDIILSQAEFEKQYHADFTKQPQYSLHKAISFMDKEKFGNVRIVYDFGKIILFANQLTESKGTDNTGAFFSYPNKFFDPQANPGFDYQTITSVFFITSMDRSVNK